MNNGLAQISYLVISALSGKMPITGITILPGLGNNVVEMTKATRKVIDADGPFKKEFADNKVHPLLINMFPPYQMILKSGRDRGTQGLSGQEDSFGRKHDELRRQVAGFRAGRDAGG